MDKKGVVGLDTSKKVMLALMIMGILAFTILIVLQSMTDTSVAATTGSGSTLNETLTVVNETGVTFDISISGLPDVVCSLSSAIISSSGDTIDSANYTVTNCNIAYSAGVDAAVNNTVWKVTYTHTFNRISGINANISGGVESFFSNAGTWFALLAIVIIIMIVVVVMKSVDSIGNKGRKGL